ncbi:MAG TPA: amidase [Solirubrobacter sp.]|nr:amidase [Solirubrobacter sp.]
MDDLAFASADELAALVRTGGASAREVVEAALRRIEALEPELNAFIEIDGERALAAADAVTPGPEQPFAGVPIAVKGNVPVEGLELNYGSRFLAGHRPDHSAYLVRRLRDAGFVVVGVTNLPEFGILPTTEPRHTGATRNPWDPARTPGGSSGGSAAAVASGMLPLAHGNDGGGSLRIPAACCGLIGLKPSRGRVSRGPDLGESWLACDGVLTRTVADTAYALDVLGGYEVGDANWAPRPVEPYATAMRRDPGRLRIAVTAENAFAVEADPEALEGLRVAAELLAALGHEVVEVSPAWPPPDVLDIFINVFGPAIALGINSGVLRAGREPADDEIEPLSRALFDRARETPSIGYLMAVAQLQALARGLVAFFADYDVLVTPALAERPLAIGECHGYGEHPLRDLARSGRFTPYTSLFNITGQPALALPVGFGSDGLPTAVQLVGKPLNEDCLLQLAAQIETAHPWAHQRPEPLTSGAD